MKRKVLLRGVVLVLGLLLLACGNPAGGNTGSGGDGGNGGDDIVLNGTWWVRTGAETYPEIITFTSASNFSTVNAGGTWNGTYIVSGNSFTASVPGTGEFQATVSGNKMTQGTGVHIKLMGTSWKFTDGNDSKTITFTDDSNFTLDDNGSKTSGTYGKQTYNVGLTVNGQNKFVDFKVGNPVVLPEMKLETEVFILQ